ncbi:YqkE family protein [Caldibacillus lycopersici]|uniref:YqkE family protein n=1 Tax=Perspicuibacillus lycopersici TaxID=1325689 RepID=A0AAE3ISF1_9BACI|nr:YqkE family protein [Perspicuibacillus lycopersici]MCU9613778.1 YqkE family protein [Perspicuibacillus lycopersici]
MKKKQPIKDEGPLTLKDALGSDLLKKLKETKKQLEDSEVKKKAEEAERKREEQRQKEKNKSFEELLNESDFDWRKFK